MIFRNKYTGKINFIAIAATSVVIVFIIAIICVVLSETSRSNSMQYNTVSPNASSNNSIVEQTSLNSESSSSEESSEEPTKELTANYPEYDEKVKKLTSKNIHSKYAVLLDVKNNKILAERNSETIMYPASMSKLMTLLVAVENIKDFNDTFTLTYDMIAPLIEQEAARAGFEDGETVTITDLLYGLILPSGSDAAMALVAYVSGNEKDFVSLMNKKAQELGMKNSKFAHATGLHDMDHYSTATDIAILMKAVMENPTCRQIVGSESYTTTSTKQHPGGLLLLNSMYKRMYGNEVNGMSIIGGKTGFTDQAMQCLVSYSRAVDGNEYVAVTAYAPTDMDTVFDSFAIYGLINGGYEMPTDLEEPTYPPTHPPLEEETSETDEDGEIIDPEDKENDSESGEEETTSTSESDSE
ncbi:MAG: D-alanyl-D-alanine carboxypeptidase [Ruminococcus sp.]|nr:D-alanyl-D-alanine carboxypeptidase [Ruminococcus sp.]